MAKISTIMDTGRRSMMNSQTALQTVGHNIANKTTEGYSRQRVELQSNEPLGTGKLRIGTGAKTALITRINNPFLERQIGAEQAKLGFMNSKAETMGRVEQVYNESLNKGVNYAMSEFFNSFQELSNNPESLASRTQVQQTAQGLTQEFKRVSTQLDGIQKGIDQEISVTVKEVNDLSKEIASLNEKVQTVQMQGGPANDERDRRDLLIKQLGERVNIRWAEGDDGQVTITAGNSAVIVSGYETRKLGLSASPTTEGDTKPEGSFDITYRNSDKGEAFKVTSQMTGGRLGGLLETRDKAVSELHDKIDGMAESVLDAVNAVHKDGVTAFNRKGGEFFSLKEEGGHSAARIQLADAIQEDVGHIAAAGGINSPGDNRTAAKIGHLQFEGVMDEGTATLNEFYNNMVGEIGEETKRVQTAHQSQSDAVKQLNTMRESLSGVSLDEETTKLVEFQKAFDASARLIKTADEMFDTVLNLKRL